MKKKSEPVCKRCKVTRMETAGKVCSYCIADILAGACVRK